MTVTSKRDRPVLRDASTSVVPSPGIAVRLSAALAGVAVVAAGLTLFVPRILYGPAAMNGSARGTALVMLVIAVPVVTAGCWWATTRRSVRGVVVWSGGLAYLLYNAVLFLLATPFNTLFLLYVAMLSLAIWSVLALSGRWTLTRCGRGSRRGCRYARSPNTCGRSRR